MKFAFKIKGDSCNGCGATYSSLLCKNGWLFKELHLVSSAGTYIKEFIHGDLGRTLPNVGSLL